MNADPSAPLVTSAPRAARVLSEQLRSVYASMKPAAIAGTVGPILIAAMFWEMIPHWRIVVWWCLVAATLGIGSLLLRHWFLRSNALPHDTDRWLRLATVRALLVSLAYGSAGVFLFSVDSQTYQIILFAWLVAISALVTVETANHPWLYLCTLVPMLAPFIVRAAIHARQTALILAVSAAILLVYLLIGARKLNQLITESLDARFANVELVTQLQAQMSIVELARAEAEEANRAKSRFLAAASHDLRQPMHALGLFVSALKPHAVSEQGEHILERVESTVRSTEAMFNAMLDVSRLDAGVLRPDVKPFALGPLLHRLGTEYAQRTAAKGIELRVHASPHQHSVISDATLLERVIRNYLGNAVRYTQRGGVLLGARRRGKNISVEVWDTGRGIASDKWEDVFKEFLQLDNPERDREKGLGLGLAIVRRIGQLLDHPIRLTSRVDRGSMFSIELPMGVLPSTKTTGAAVMVLDDSALVGALVLVIDDEADAREALQLVLKQWGCRVLTAEGAESALALLSAQDTAPDVVLSDYRLRDHANGIDVIHTIQRQYRVGAAVLITGDTAAEPLKAAAVSGFELLHKPVDPARLKSVLVQCLIRSTSGPQR